MTRMKDSLQVLRLWARGVEEVKARGETREQRAGCLIGVRADPSYVEFMAGLEHLAQFLGQLVQGESHAILAQGWQDRPGQAVVGDFNSSWVDAVLGLVQEGDSLPHDGGVGSAPRSVVFGTDVGGNPGEEPIYILST